MKKILLGILILSFVASASHITPEWKDYTLDLTQILELSECFNIKYAGYSPVNSATMYVDETVTTSCNQTITLIGTALRTTLNGTVHIAVFEVTDQGVTESIILEEGETVTLFGGRFVIKFVNIEYDAAGDPTVSIEYLDCNNFATFNGLYRGVPLIFSLNNTYGFKYYKGDQPDHVFGTHFNGFIDIPNTINVSIVNNLACEAGGGVEINIDPDTINKKSRGRWITAYIESHGLTNEWLVDTILGCENGTIEDTTFRIGETKELCGAKVTFEKFFEVDNVTNFVNIAIFKQISPSGSSLTVAIPEGEASSPFSGFVSIEVKDIYTKDFPENFAWTGVSCTGLQGAFYLEENDVLQCANGFMENFFYIKSTNVELGTADYEVEYTPTPMGSPVTETFTLNNYQTKTIDGVNSILKVSLMYASRGFIQGTGGGFDVMDIDVNTLTLTTPDGSVFYAVNDLRYGFVRDPQPHDEDGDGVPEFMAKFWRMPIQKVLPNGLVELIVSGETHDGITFEGSDTVRVIGNLFTRFGRFSLQSPKFF